MRGRHLSPLILSSTIWRSRPSSMLAVQRPLGKLHLISTVRRSKQLIKSHKIDDFGCNLTMTMTIDSNHQQRFGFAPMSSYSSHAHLSNPWAPTSSAGSQSGSHALFVGGSDGGLPHLNLNGLAKPPQPLRSAGPSSSLAPYNSLSSSAGSAGSSLMAADIYGQPNLRPPSQDLSLTGRMPHIAASAAGYDSAAFTTPASPVNASYATSSSTYGHVGYAPAPIRSAFGLPPESDSTRRYPSHLPPSPQDDRKSFQDALEASHGMLSMSQETPRNIYDVRSRQRASADSYGFPSAHSTRSSVSSSGPFSSYYPASVDGSVSDYSTAGSDIESPSGHTLPRSQGLLSNQPPAPQSMMGSFSSKVSSTQKKHKCKVCDKRFTRPSSLQTHVYSHTGEKPFSCPVPGCGRNFSVVSNLRRHRKVHKGTDGSSNQVPDTPSDAGSVSEEQLLETDKCSSV